MYERLKMPTFVDVIKKKVENQYINVRENRSDLQEQRIQRHKQQLAIRQNEDKTQKIAPRTESKIG